MPTTRYPWRTVTLAAISIIGNAYLGYLLVFGLAADGAGVEDRAGHAYVTTVDPDSPAVRAGLMAKDRLVSVNGQSIENVVDWLAQRMNFAQGQPIAITVERAGQRADLTMVVQGKIWNDYNRPTRVSEVIFLGYKLIILLIGLFVVFSRPRDFASRMGGWVLVVMATVFEAFQWGMSSSLRTLPFVLAWPVMLVYVSAAFRTPLLAAFFCLFPRKLFQRRWIWAAFFAGPLVATVYALYLFARTIYDPAHLTGLAPPWVLVAFGLQSVLYLVLGLVILPISYWRLETLTDRRRFRVLCFGTLAGMLFYLPRVIGTALVDFSPAAIEYLNSPTINLVSSVGTLIFPISFAYAILRQRLFDVRVIIRQGLQYAFARNFLLAIPLFAAGLLLLDLVFHGREPLFVVMKTRGGFYVAVAALAGLAYAQRQSWLSSLDRRFFRDKYDAQQLFRAIVEGIRKASTLEEVAPTVVTRVSEALHAQFCALLVRRAGESLYRVTAAAPPGALTSDLPASNKLVPLVRMLDKPVPVLLAESGWLGQQLPQVDKDFLHDARIDLLVPVVLTEGSTEALLVLGAKLSEEPYSSEDTVLLENVASAMALLLMRGAAPLHGRVFEECPACGACYDTGTSRCSKEGSLLTLVAGSRMLAERYRLESRLGQGGMGKVYRATDLSLNRGVAVKMIRDDFFSDRTAMVKFRQEAQVTGSFAHPNVVAVHDFGVDANQRAFLVMELLAGITLREELRAEKRLQPVRILDVFEHVCAGVGAAHARGLVHRDLKPENIFLVRTTVPEVVKITDFGIAKALRQVSDQSNETLTGVVAGTMRYMSPEQLRMRPLSPRWDVWALSVIAFEALCGCPPFSGIDFAALQSAIMGVSFPEVSSLIPDAPARWQEFFSRAFAPIEEERPESITVFWAELRECLGSGLPEGATKKPPPL